MSSVDNRVVEMKFDNNKFEQGIQSTLGWLDKLKESLKFGGAEKGMQDMQKAADGFSLQSMADNVQNVSSHFSAMGVVWFNVISRMTNAAIDAGKRMGHAILGPIIEGGKRRSLAIEQAKFQFQGLGIDVTKAMDSAMQAVDGTAFGLDAAASVAAQFGASGMKAGTQMTTALRSIAGMAAMTGSSFEDVGQIYTTIAGNGRLMSEQLLQFSSRGINAAAALSKQLGVSEADVRKMVSAGKIDFQTFYTAMDQAFGAHAKEAGKTFEGALDNMHAALGRIGQLFADPIYDNLRKVFSAVTPVINAVKNALKPFAAEFGHLLDSVTGSTEKLLGGLNLGGFDKIVAPLTNAMKNAFETMKSIMGAMRGAISDVFPPTTTNTFVKMSKAVESFSAALKSFFGNAKNLDGLRRTFAGLFALFDIGWQLLKGLAQGVLSLFGAFNSGSGGILNFTGSIGDLLVALDKAIKEGNVFGNFFKSLGSILSVPLTLIVALAKAIGGLFSGWNKKDADEANKSMDSMSKSAKEFNNLGEGIRRVASAIYGFFKKVGQVVAPVAKSVGNFLKDFMSAIKESFSKGNFDSVINLLNTGLLGGILFAMRKFFTQGLNVNVGGGISAQIVGSLTQLQNTLRVFQVELKAKTLLEIAAAISMIAASVLVLSTINAQKLTVALTAMGVGFGQLMAAMAILTKISGTAGFLKIPVITTGLIGLASSMLLFATATKIMSTMDWNGLAKGMTGMAATILLISVAMKPLSKGGGLNLIAVGAGMTALGVGMSFMAASIKIFAAMSWKELGSGLAMVTATLVGIGVAMRAMPTKSMVGNAISLNLVASALMGLYFAVNSFSHLSLESMGKGLAGVAGSLVVLAGAMRIMPKGMVLQAAALDLVAIALNGIAIALGKMGGLSWEQIARGLTGLAGSLVILAGALHLMSGTLGGSAALTVASVGILALSNALSTLGKMSWGDLGKALVALAAGLTVVGVAGLLLAPVIVPLLGLGVALTLLSVALLAAGVAAGLFGTALTVFIGAIGSGMTMIINSIKGVIDIFNLLWKTVFNVFTQIVNFIVTQGPVIVAGMANLVVAIANAIATMAVGVAQAISNMITGILNVIASSVKNFINAGGNIILNFLNGMRQKIPQVITGFTNMIIDSMASIGKNAWRFVRAAADTVLTFLHALEENATTYARDFTDTGINIAANLMKGIAQGIMDNLPGPLKAALKMSGGIAGMVKDFLGIGGPSKLFCDFGRYTMEGFADGVTANAYKPIQAMANVNNQLAQSVQTTSQIMMDGFDTNFDLTPVIAPVVDLTNITQSAQEMTDMLQTPVITADVSTSSATDISNQNQSLLAQQQADDTQNTGTTIIQNFEQNNTSPDALSESDIYRNTRNQLSMAKEALAVA